MLPLNGWGVLVFLVLVGAFLWAAKTGRLVQWFKAFDAWVTKTFLPRDPWA